MPDFKGSETDSFLQQVAEIKKSIVEKIKDEGLRSAVADLLVKQPNDENLLILIAEKARASGMEKDAIAELTDFVGREMEKVYTFVEYKGISDNKTQNNIEK